MEIFDLREAIIPFSLLQITNCFHRMLPGETIQIVGHDASITEDLKRILPAATYEMKPCADRPQSGADFHILIKKTLSDS
jgi:TusA-related sulfurtransferase